MPTAIWEPKAGAVAQVDTVTIANTWAQGDTITATINNKSLVVTIGTLVTTAQVATTLKQAWEDETLTDTSASFVPEDGGQDFAEHSEVTATVSASVVTLTGPRGAPFTLSVTETTAGDGTATEATATAATGPNHYDNAANWSTAAVPQASDDVVIGNSDVSILWGLDDSSTLLTSFTKLANFTGTIGLPRTSAGGYTEYREGDGYLQIQCPLIDIGTGDGPGSGRIKIDSGSTTASTVRIFSSGSSLEVGLPAIQWIGTHANGVIEAVNGDVGVAVGPGESATLATLTVTNATFRGGPGLALTDAVFNQATVTLADIGSGNMEQFGGQTTILQSSTTTCTLYRLWGGTLIYNGDSASGADFTTLELGGTNDASTFDLSQNPHSSLSASNMRMLVNVFLFDPGRILTTGQTLSIRDGVRIVSTA